jgi:hypothetical protein
MSGGKEDGMGMPKCKPNSTAGLHANLVEDEDDKYRYKQQGSLRATSNMESSEVQKELDNNQLTGWQRSKSPDRKNAIKVALTVIPLLLATVEVLGPNDVREPRGAHIALGGTPIGIKGTPLVTNPKPTNNVSLFVRHVKFIFGRQEPIGLPASIKLNH